MDTKKMYNGHAKEFNDPIEGPKIRKREEAASKMNEWRGEPDVEMICTAFITFLWESSKSTAALLKEERDDEARRNKKANERK
jgi:transcriptional regulator of met regulon